MNYSASSQKYDSTSQQPSNINNYNHYYQQVQQCPGYYPQFYHQYQPFVYQQNSYFNTPVNNGTGYFNPIPQQMSDSNVGQNSRNKVTEKRESKPLTVFDPNKNEVLDLEKISKSKNGAIDPNKNDVVDLEKMSKTKNGSLLDEIKNNDNLPSIILKSDIDSSSKHSENIIAEIEESQAGEVLIINKDTEIKKSCLFPFSASQPMKQSHSIPNKLDNLSEKNLSHRLSSSSETDLHQKSNLSCNNLSFIEMFNNERRIYNRDSLLEIGKSKRSLKLPLTLEDFECKEIIVSELSDVIKLSLNQNYGLNKKKAPEKYFNFGSQKSASLSRIANGYLPPYLRVKEEFSQNKHLHQYRRNLKGILNKIAPQNFDLCVNEIKTIVKSIDQQNVKIGDCIDCLIEEIFDKAVKEETYARTYADLCTQIAKLDDENESKLNFKPSLLNRCKKMFETPLQDQLKCVKEHWKQKVIDESDEKLKAIYRSDIEEQIKKARDKYFGNIRFIGELYLHNLLKPTIINCCVTSLMPKSNDEDAMLSLCKLIETCGKIFDEKHQDKMDSYIKSMNEIIEKNHLETRIRFRILDIIEMRERNWALRKIQAQKMIQPKTLDEVKNDDTEDKAIAASKFSISKQQNRLNNKSLQNSNELKFKQSQTRNQSIDLNSLSVAQSDNFDLKPSYGSGSWSCSSKEKDLTEWTNVDNKKRSRNKYPQSGKHSQISAANKSSPNRSSEESGSKIVSASKFSVLFTDEEKNDHNTPRLNSPFRDPSPNENKIEEDVVMMDGDELFDNLLETKQLNEAGWCNQSDFGELISQWMDRIMEKNEAVRNLVGDVLADLVAHDKLPKDKLISGVKQFTELIDDLITDIPKIWTFLAQFLERFIQNASSDVEFYNVIFKDRLSDKKAAECLVLILKYAANRLGVDVTKTVVDNHLRSLLASLIDNKDFQIHNQLMNISFSIESEISLSDSKFSDPFKSELISRLSDDVESIYGLLESKYDMSIMLTDEFVYFMAHCLFSYICDLPSTEEIANFLMDKQLFFIRLINDRSSNETQTILALVNLATSLEEKGSLSPIINNLLNGKIMSKDAFLHFVENAEFLLQVLRASDEDLALTVNAIRSSLDSDQR